MSSGSVLLTLRDWNSSMIRNFSLFSMRIKNIDRLLRFDRVEISIGTANRPSKYLAFSTLVRSIVTVPAEKLSISFCRLAAARPVCFSLKNLRARLVALLRFAFSF